MPITAKFSQEFYDKLGHGVADELVDWFNQVDVTYRSEFRELFALHFAQFDAKLEQRVAELRAEFRTELRDSTTPLETRLIRWMFAFWTGTTVMVIGVMFALLKL
ncbi:MAG TPA: hypothetical protein VGA22_02155 [Gemmatimonadales bacterium]|jgi:dsDNA-binding SOS-regulon protein